MNTGYFEKHALIQHDGIWGRRKFYYGSDGVDYICRHMDPDAATSDDGWYVWKFIYVSTNLDDIQGPLRGTADGRAALGWV